MSVQRINKMLWAVAGVLALAAIAIVVAAMMRPAQSASFAVYSNTRPRSSVKEASSLPPLADLQQVAETPLRKLLGEAPPTPAPEQPVVAAAQVPAEQIPLTLVGTIGTSLAMLRGSDGTIQLAAVGEETAGVKVISIRPSKVDVQFNGRSVQLETPKEPNPG